MREHDEGGGVTRVELRFCPVLVLWFDANIMRGSREQAG